jgi:purine-cytosine permease-like protein
MGMNGYSGMLTVVTALDSIRRLRPTRRTRIIAILGLTVLWLALSEGLGGNAIGAMNGTFVVMLYLLVPWTAINLTDYYFVRRGYYSVTDLFTPDGLYGRWRREGLLAYFIGFFVSLPFLVIPEWVTMPMAALLGGIDIGWLVGLLVTALVYLFLSRHHDHQVELPFVLASREALDRINRGEHPPAA